MGYLGGVVLLIVVWIGLVAGQGGVVGAPTEDGFNIRLVALLCAVWFAVLAVPLFAVVPETTPVNGAARPGLTEAYRGVGRDLRGLYATDRTVLMFLGASALYRDGLAAIAVFGAVLGVTVFDLDASDVLLFGVAADVVAAAGALAGGVLEDHIGPKRVVLGSLVGLLLAGVVLQLGSGPVVFWTVGLTLTLFVGPVQSSSRTFLARLAPAGQEGQIFGLYASAGRATSFLAPTVFGLVVAVTGATRAGMLGILLVLAAGAVALVPVRAPRSGVGHGAC